MGLIETYDNAIAAFEMRVRNMENGIVVQENNLALARKCLAEHLEHLAALKAPRDALAVLYPTKSNDEQAGERKP